MKTRSSLLTLCCAVTVLATKVASAQSGALDLTFMHRVGPMRKD